MRIFLRKLHRWLGLLMALQIIAWMASGLYFSLFPIGEIRGEHLTRPPTGPILPDLIGSISPDQAWQAAVAGLADPLQLDDMTLVNRWGETWFRVSGKSSGQPFRRLVNVKGGEVRPALDGDAARRLADSLLLYPGRGVAVEWLEEVSSSDEARGRNLPLWRVSYTEPESLSLYLDPWTGDLVASRTTRWRIFDFLWMLHIMDFDTRDDFNTLLLQVAALLGLLVALSGVIYWALSSPLFRRRRPGPP